MKRTIAASLAILLVFVLCSCSGVGGIEPPTMPSVEPASGYADENANGNGQDDDALQDPADATGNQEPVDLGAQVIVNIVNHTEEFMAPDNDRQRILTFSYDTVGVHIEGNDAASDAINHMLAVEDELFYSGTGNGDGVNSMLEQATDNYAIAQETGEDMNLELSSMRTASVSRADSRVLSLIYLTHNYTGGAHGYYFERAWVYDTQSGDRLTLRGLCQDYDAFSAFLVDRMLQQAQQENSGVDLVEGDELSAKLIALLRDGSWYFDDSGLVVFSDVYEISSYAAGIIYFHITYDELRPYVDEALFPVKRHGEGSVSIGLTESSGSQMPILDRVVVHPEGEDVLLTIAGTVYDLEIATVSYISDDVGFYETAEHWACSYMSDSAIQVITSIPDGMPNLMIRYRTTDGVIHKQLITQSGEDGSLILADSSIAAVG